ncbi:unnamed protein product [Nesidiocoris tenuis]|uniref:Uncharacterized protein n=1 Tax=Nesidiocoris tenuis TaxID=355587 RepID=A0A6H5GPQ3_9HEMI|nr:unnamed protein product [Nesidiocoris tenuis]
MGSAFFKRYNNTTNSSSNANKTATPGQPPLATSVPIKEKKPITPVTPLTQFQRHVPPLNPSNVALSRTLPFAAFCTDSDEPWGFAALKAASPQALTPAPKKKKEVQTSPSCSPLSFNNNRISPSSLVKFAVNSKAAEAHQRLLAGVRPAVKGKECPNRPVNRPPKLLIPSRSFPSRPAMDQPNLVTSSLYTWSQKKLPMFVVMKKFLLLVQQTFQGCLAVVQLLSSSALSISLLGILRLSLKNTPGCSPTCSSRLRISLLPHHRQGFLESPPRNPTLRRKIQLKKLPSRLIQKGLLKGNPKIRLQRLKSLLKLQKSSAEVRGGVRLRNVHTRNWRRMISKLPKKRSLQAQETPKAKKDVKPANSNTRSSRSSVANESRRSSDRIKIEDVEVKMEVDSPAADDAVVNDSVADSPLVTADEPPAKKRRGWISGVPRKGYVPKATGGKAKTKIVRKWGVKPRKRRPVRKDKEADAEEKAAEDKATEDVTEQEEIQESEAVTENGPQSSEVDEGAQPQSPPKEASDTSSESSSEDENPPPKKSPPPAFSHQQNNLPTPAENNVRREEEPLRAEQRVPTFEPPVLIPLVDPNRHPGLPMPDVAKKPDQPPVLEQSRPFEPMNSTRDVQESRKGHEQSCSKRVKSNSDPDARKNFLQPSNEVDARKNFAQQNSEAEARKNFMHQQNSEAEARKNFLQQQNSEAEARKNFLQQQELLKKSYEQHHQEMMKKSLELMELQKKGYDPLGFSESQKRAFELISSQEQHKKRLEHASSMMDSHKKVFEPLPLPLPSSPMVDHLRKSFDPIGHSRMDAKPQEPPSMEATRKLIQPLGHDQVDLTHTDDSRSPAPPVKSLAPNPHTPPPPVLDSHHHHSHHLHHGKEEEKKSMNMPARSPYPDLKAHQERYNTSSTSSSSMKDKKDRKSHHSTSSNLNEDSKQSHRHSDVPQLQSKQPDISGMYPNESPHPLSHSYPVPDLDLENTRSLMDAQAQAAAEQQRQLQYSDCAQQGLAVLHHLSQHTPPPHMHLGMQTQQGRLGPSPGSCSVPSPNFYLQNVAAASGTPSGPHGPPPPPHSSLAKLQQLTNGLEGTQVMGGGTPPPTPPSHSTPPPPNNHYHKFYQTQRHPTIQPGTGHNMLPYQSFANGGPTYGPPQAPGRSSAPTGYPGASFMNQGGPPPPPSIQMQMMQPPQYPGAPDPSQQNSINHWCQRKIDNKRDDLSSDRSAPEPAKILSNH